VRLAILIVCAMLLELGWLALWPLSAALSHSALFTADLLETHPLIALVLQTTARLEPGLATATLTDALGSPAYSLPAISLAGVMLALFGVYGLSLLLLDRGLGKHRAAAAVVFAGAVVFQLTLLYLPGVFSQDVFGYIAYGRLAAVYDLNPYIWPPSVLRDPVVGWVADVWRTYASPYGPAWVNLQWLLARATTSLSIVDQALIYRALASALLLGNLALAWRLLGRLTPLSFTQRTTSLAALAWNPLILFEVAGNAHNDILMVSFCFLALLLFRTSSRGLLSSAALTFGALVKYLSGVGLIWLALAAAARARTWRWRAARVAALVVVSLVITLLLAAPWLELPDSMDPLLNETAGVGFVNSLPDTLVLMLVDHLGAPLDPARNFERVACIATFGVYLVWEARRVWTDPSRAAVARGLARSCLVYVLVASTSVQTWYFCLPLSIALVLGWRRRLARISLAYSALALPALYLSYYLRDTLPAWIFLVYACAPLLVLLPDALRAVRQPRFAPAATRPKARPTPQAIPAPVMERASR
jgi:hypothetical protein